MTNSTRIPVGVCPFGCLHYSDEIAEIIEYRTVTMFGVERNVVDVKLRGALLPMSLNLDLSAYRGDFLEDGTPAWLDESEGIRDDWKAEAEADAAEWKDEQQTRESVFQY